jgi:hypothetical protein
LAIFVGIPALILVVVSALAFGGRGQRSRRYRPGRPFDFAPVWFLSSPEQLAESAGAVLPAGAQAPALTSTEVEHKAPARAAVTGGASDRW